MNKHLGGKITIGIAIVFSFVCAAAGAQDLGKLGSMIPGGSSMTSGSMGNVAGLLEYCMKNNYLGGDSGASGIKDQLLGKMGGSSGSTTNSNQSASTSDMLGELTGSKKKSSSSTSSNPTSDAGYLSGAKGILQGSDGKSMDLNSIGGGSSDMKSQMTTKVCDTVLKQGKSLLSK
jgi:hypothetical protein